MTLQRLLLISIGHLLLAPLAFIASLRLGPLITFAIGLAVIVALADIVQLIWRATLATLSVEYFVLLAFNLVLLGVSVLQLIALSRLRQADAEVNNVVADSDGKEKRAAMVRQESNALRAIAVFDFIAVVVILVTIGIFGSFSTTLQLYTLFYLGHLLLVPLALFAAPAGGLWVPIFMLVALVQMALDLLALTLRLLAEPGAALLVVNLENIISTVLLAIAAFYIIIDVAYVTTGFGLSAAMAITVDRAAEQAESASVQPTKTVSLAAPGMRQRVKGGK